MSSPYGKQFDGAKWPWSLRDNGPDWDWHVLVDANGQYVSDACVEGTSEEWRDIAAALRAGSNESFKRCAVRWNSPTDFSMYSPRNSVGGQAPLSGHAKANELADIIDAALDAYAKATASAEVRQ